MLGGFESISENSDTSFDHYTIYDQDSEPEDDYGKGGFMKIKLKSIVADHYELLQKIGWGHAGVIYLIKDKSSNTFKAMKLIKSHSYYRQEFKDEVKILKKINAISEGKYTAKLFEHFKIESKGADHTCAIYELLGVSLYEILKYYEFKGLPIALCRFIAKELLKGLEFFHNECRIIVGDLRLKNILLPLTKAQTDGLAETEMLTEKLDFAIFKHTETPVSILNKALGCNFPLDSTKKPKQPKGKKGKKSGSAKNVLKQLNKIGLINEEFTIKFTNLSSACEIDGNCAREVPTLNYRSPEVVLKLSNTTAIDMWSFGCILFELVTGYYLFEPIKGTHYRKEDDLLAQFTETLGQLPLEYCQQSIVYNKYFDSTGRLKNMHILREWPLLELLIEKYGIIREEAAALSDFLKQLMCYIPEQRLTATQALAHPWLKMPPREETHSTGEKLKKLSQDIKAREFAHWQASLMRSQSKTL